MTSNQARRAAAVLVAMLLAAFAAPAVAQDKAAEAQAAELDKFIVQVFDGNRNKSLCMLGNIPVPLVRGAVLEQLKASGLKVGETATREQVEAAIWTRFPCPFSPFRPELLPATRKDVEGVWLFPHDSQPYRYGSESLLQPKTAKEAIACEAVALYASGEYRTGAVPGAGTRCPFQMASDVDPARKRPRVLNWSMPSDGHLKVTRTDDKDYVEEWDVYSVSKTFQALNMEIRAGDLVAFKRREKGLDPSVSTEFRHLKRLP